jgi:hypothetical protein
MVDVLVGSGYSPAQKSKAIASALAEFGFSDGDSDSTDAAVSRLVAVLLNNQRITEKAKTDNSLLSLIKDPTVFITKEMERLKSKASRSSTLKGNYSKLIKITDSSYGD